MANFNVNERKEAETWANLIRRKFNKEIIKMPKNAFMEFGEVIYLETSEGRFYFGGLSRANKIGHDFIIDILKPDKKILIESKGYHLDTVFTPILSKENKIIAFIIAEDAFSKKSLKELKSSGKEIIRINMQDSFGKKEKPGNNAVNALVSPGVIVNCCKFTTIGVEEKLKELGIKRFISPLTYFNYAGGSYHCLTNEI